MVSLRLSQRALRLCLYLIAALLVAPAYARAQSANQAPAHIDFVEGTATLEREGQADPAAPGVPFVPGDRVRTAGGRVEILFPDGTVLDVDEYTSLDLQSPTLLRATEGRLLLNVAGASNPSTAIRYQIDTPIASATTDTPGEFRVAILSTPTGLHTEFAVLRGAGSLTTERGSTGVRAGERSLARDNEPPSYAQPFNSARFDAFDRWAAVRRDSRLGTATSAQNLPGELRFYGSYFDRYGSWRYEPDYGNVWYPVVDVGWRPYYDGYWEPVRTYGWTWIGYDVWSWPTHHYGRWGHRHDRWFWIPERHYSAAWVSWGAAPGYVSWCPLGFDNRPVFALSINVGDPWVGWTVVPRTHFGWYSTPQWAIAPYRLNRNTPFIAQATPPVGPTYAIPRPSGSVAGMRAVPRTAGGTSPVPSAQQTNANPPFIDRSAVQRGGNRNPDSSLRPGPGNGRVSTGGDSRLSPGDPQTPGMNRQPYAVDRGLRAPDGSTVRMNRSVPRDEQRQNADVFLKQPLGGGVASAPARRVEGTRSPDTSRAYQRYPGGSVTYAPPAASRAPQAAQPANEAAQPAAPGWRTYSAPVGRAPSRAQSPPPTTPSISGVGSAVPRWQPYYGSSPRVESPRPEAAPPSRVYSPPPRSSSPPPSRAYSPPPSYSPTPSYQPAPSRSAPMAVPRSAPPPAASPAPSNDGGGGSAPRSSGSGGSSGGGGRQRHPSGR
jgi:uncharacterized protein DUF6600/FecR-like protein